MEIKKLGIIGFGQMGAGIGQVFAQAGYDVVAVDSSESMLAKGLKGIDKRLMGRVEKGKLSEADKNAIMARIKTSTKIDDLKDCDLIEEEIPEDPRRRLELVRKIVDVATGKYGIPIEDIVIDPLAMPVGADTSLVLSTLETIRLVREEFGLNMTLGASNVSFGMPDRPSIGSAFLPMAIVSGLTSAIMDARSPQLVRAVKAADLLTNKDPWGAAWIAAHRAAQAAQAQAPT